MTEIQEWYKNILENLYDGVYLVNLERQIEYWNKGAERITGYQREHVLGRYCQDNFLNHVTANGHQLCLNGCPLHATMADGQPREAEVFLHHEDGYRVPVMVRTMPIRDEKGVITGAVEVFSDNSTMDGMRRQVRHLEQTNQMDELTGVGNRRFIEKRIRLALREFNATGRPFGILFIDLDDFKGINDQWGHSTGDRILRLVASTLQRNIRGDDALGRWGGEEFVVLLADVDPLSVRMVAEKLRSLIERTRSRHLPESFTASVSIGCTLIRPKDTLTSLVGRGDRSMYHCKHLGKNRVCLDEDD